MVKAAAASRLTSGRGGRDVVVARLSGNVRERSC